MQRIEIAGTPRRVCGGSTDATKAGGILKPLTMPSPSEKRC
jgi:hypothetical protein